MRVKTCVLVAVDYFFEAKAMFRHLFINFGLLENIVSNRVYFPSIEGIF